MHAATALYKISQEIDEKVQRLQECVSSGHAKGFPEYKELCGEIKGLLTTKSYITDLNKTLEHDDD